MDGNRTADWAASPDWADRFFGALSRGSHWSSITTAWVKIRWATGMVSLHALESILTTASRSSTMTARRGSWTKWHSLSLETWAASMEAREPALARRGRSLLTM